MSMEKPYGCGYCLGRFMRKNEAVRHENKHKQQKIWSCAALDGFRVAFGPATSGTGEMDDCGYCGKEFPNLPQPDWNARKYHLEEVHGFGQCNREKRFYRADHFKQHLVHSHGAQNGKWTKRLQEASLTQEHS